MKKLLVITLMLVSFAKVSSAETTFNLKADFLKSSETYKTELYWQGQKFGAGLDVVSTPKADFMQSNPYLTLKVNKTPIQLVTGVLTSSTGADYFHVGIWYCETFGKTNIFVEIREYIGNGKTVDFLDTFLEVTYPVNQKVSLGINTIYDYNWTGSNRTWVQGGPILYYKVKDGMTVFVRATKETGEVDRLRIGIRFNF